MGRKEAVIENYLRDRVKALGGITRKIVYQGRSGAPDQMCIMPGGKVYFIECKAPGEAPDPHQLIELSRLQMYGCHAHWVDSKEAVNLLFVGYDIPDGYL